MLYSSVSVSVSLYLYLAQSDLCLLSAVPLGRLEQWAAGLAKYPGRPRIFKSHKIYTSVFSHQKTLPKEILKVLFLNASLLHIFQSYTFLLPHCHLK